VSRSEADAPAHPGVDRPRTAVEDRALADACRQALTDYRAAVVTGGATRALTARARRAFLRLGGDPARSSASLKDYDHARYGPFLGVSDEGSAAGQIRAAAFESPKVRALPKTVAPTPLVVGVAVDAERLGGIGEVAVGPDEYADVWLESVDRVLITTNIGTRVNMRVYRREPLVVLERDSKEAIDAAQREIEAAFKPFIETPDNRPRPLTVFVDIPRYARMTTPRKRAALRKLVEHVSSGRAAGKGRKAAPPGQALGLAVRTRLGPPGKEEAIAAIDLAASVGMKVVAIDGVKRRDADRAVSLAGLLDYFPPGLVGPILRAAAKKGVRVRTANLPDTDTIARSTWVGLTTARSCGASLGKYGCFPLTRLETDHVVQQIQGWLPDWSAAPVFFVDQGLLHEDRVDVGRDLSRGLRSWLEAVAARGVRVVLIDTIDKATGKRLLKKSSQDESGFLGPNQVKDAEDLARRLGIKVLWAGGMGLRDAYEMGKLRVFGIYVTSAAATTIPVEGSYRRDPSLAGVKEPSKEAVLRTKILLEAGFLAAKRANGSAARIERLAQEVLTAHDSGNAAGVATLSTSLASECAAGWRAHWKDLADDRGSRRGRVVAPGRG
jgi:hypothetical protein